MGYRNYFPSHEGRAALRLRRNELFFKHNVTGNKSGAPKLTLFKLKHRRGNDPLTRMAQRCAVSVPIEAPHFVCRPECALAHAGASQPVPILRTPR
jgi:hypothetical protein